MIIYNYALISKLIAIEVGQRQALLSSDQVTGSANQRRFPYDFGSPRPGALTSEAAIGTILKSAVFLPIFIQSPHLAAGQRFQTTNVTMPERRRPAGGREGPQHQWPQLKEKDLEHFRKE